MYKIFFIALFFMSTPLSALIISASFFNTHFSISNPLVLEENTTIELDEDITFTATGSLFLIQNAADPIILTFTQNNTHQFHVFVAGDATLNASAFINQNQIIMFEKTNLILQDTGTILLNGGKLAFFKEGTIVLSH